MRTTLNTRALRPVVRRARLRRSSSFPARQDSFAYVPCIREAAAHETLADIVARNKGSFGTHVPSAWERPQPLSTQRHREGYIRTDECQLADLQRITSEEVAAHEYPLASAVVSNVVVYERSQLNLDTPLLRHSLQTEFMHCLMTGPGIVVVRGAFDHEVVDRVSAAFSAILAGQGANAADHFGRPGANGRIWNALEKLAVEEPEAFVRYYANDTLNLISEAWLGPNYQLTSQVNLVPPGGLAQDMHRDYHLGFCTNEEAERYPVHVHKQSPLMTLQGAVAHCDMPLESGPTTFLPHSHKYEEGYLAWRREDFKSFYEQNHVQLPLAKGDAVFFNPAVYHAAGNNTSADIHRMANLVQVNSAFGRCMETVDRARVSQAVYPHLLRASEAAEWTDAMTAQVIAASAEGYSFPTNLDLDPPVDGLAPATQAQLMKQAVDEMWSSEKFDSVLDEQTQRQRSV